MRRALVRRPAFGGLAAGLVFWWFSLVPSLLPRSWIVQAGVSAVSFVVGYGIGSLLGWLGHLGLRRLGGQPSRRLRRGGWVVLAVAAPIAVIGAMATWPRWQNDQRVLVGMGEVSVLEAVAAVVAAVGLVVVLGAGCRVAWRAIQGVDRWFDRRVSHPVAFVGTVVVVTIAMQLFMQHVAWHGFRSWANNVYSTTDRGADRGVVQPAAANLSGSPRSLVSWDTLGQQGRRFVAGATSTAQLRRFRGTDAGVVEPIRVYVGTRSAGSLDEQAALAVRELERTGAFDRAVLVVATVTGTGWIDPDAATAIEQLYGGDTAIVSLQYSYLPSWIAFLIDRQASAPAGSVLFNAVYQAWAQRPATSRPKLVVFGESLGSYGAEAAFAGFDARTSLANLVTRTDGALFAGPVSDNMIWREIVRERAAGSPAWKPVFGHDRETARVFTRAADLGRLDRSWPEPRVAYLVYPSDPVSVFRVRTLWSRPDWVKQPRGYDVAPRARWFPIVTGIQTVADLIGAFSAPAGHGHNYNVDFVGAWANVVPPPGWTDADTARLTRFLTEP